MFGKRGVVVDQPFRPDDTELEDVIRLARVGSQLQEDAPAGLAIHVNHPGDMVKRRFLDNA